MMRVRASAAPIAFAKAHLGSRQHWFSALGQRRARRAATFRPSSNASDRGAAPRRQSWPAASILTAIYHVLKHGTMYQDLGPYHFDRRSKERQKNRLVQRLAELGYAVELAPLAT